MEFGGFEYLSRKLVKLVIFLGLVEDLNIYRSLESDLRVLGD